MVPSWSTERAGPDVLVRVTCGSLYSPGSSNVGSVRKRNPVISISAVGPPMRVILGAFIVLLTFSLSEPSAANFGSLASRFKDWTNAYQPALSAEFAKWEIAQDQAR